MKFKLQINALVVGVLLIAWIVPARSQVVKLPWKSLGPTGGGVNCLLQSGGSFYAGGYGTIFRSIDKGNTWSSISDSLPQATDINEIIEMDGILYAGTKNGVFLLPANGKYWESINTNWPSNTSSSNSIGPDVNRIAFVNGTLYAGTKDKGLFQYVKNPAQWKEVIDFPTKTTIKDIIGDSEVLLVATDGGTFRLKSGSWNKIDRLPVLVNCFEKKDDLTQVYAGTTDGIYFSSDKGLTWTFIPNNIPGIDKNITSLKITNNTWLAGTHPV